MRVITGLLLFLAFCLACAGWSKGDFYLDALGTSREIPDTWDEEVRYYLGALVSFLLACVSNWFEDRSLYRMGRRTFFPSACLFLRG